MGARCRPGKLASEAGIVALTDQRLLFVKGDVLGTARLDAPLDSIGGLVLGKKSSGETLRIGVGPATVIISQMGHGEGHGITAKFRERMKSAPARPRSSPYRNNRHRQHRHSPRSELGLAEADPDARALIAESIRLQWGPRYGRLLEPI